MMPPSNRHRWHLTGWITTGLCIWFTAPALASEDLDKIRQRQEKLQMALGKVMDATVVVRDGVGFGSGVVVSEDGYVLTAGHVLLSGKTDLELVFPDGRTVKAKALGKNLNVDAGMAKITEPGKWPHVQLGDSDQLRSGDWCFGLGYPGGDYLGRTPPVRIGRVLSHGTTMIRTDCALIGGDSGGPLYDLEGRLIGIHSSIGNTIDQNRHVAIAAFEKHWDRIQSGETWGKLGAFAVSNPDSGFLGVELDIRASQAVVKKVHSRSAADRVGIQSGDIIVRFDGERVADSLDLIQKVRNHAAGDRVPIELVRDGRSLTLTVELDRREGR